MSFRALSNNLQLRGVKIEVRDTKTPFRLAISAFILHSCQNLPLSRHYIQKGKSIIYNDNIGLISSAT